VEEETFDAVAVTEVSGAYLARFFAASPTLKKIWSDFSIPLI
jgi:hypothetical protein